MDSNELAIRVHIEQLPRASISRLPMNSMGLSRKAALLPRRWKLLGMWLGF